MNFECRKALIFNTLIPKIPPRISEREFCSQMSVISQQKYEKKFKQPNLFAKNILKNKKSIILMQRTILICFVLFFGCYYLAGAAVVAGFSTIPNSFFTRGAISVSCASSK